jgi:hypothetical protein
MHVNYDPKVEDWSRFVSNDLQFGGGDYEQFFSGYPYQRAGGIGDVLRSLWRFLVPLGRSAVKSIGSEGLRTASQVLNEVVEGKDVRTSLERGARTGVRNLLDKASRSLAQKGQGRRGGQRLKAFGGPTRTKDDIFA